MYQLSRRSHTCCKCTKGIDEVATCKYYIHTYIPKVSKYVLQFQPWIFFYSISSESAKWSKIVRGEVNYDKRSKLFPTWASISLPHECGGGWPAFKLLRLWTLIGGLKASHLHACKTVQIHKMITLSHLYVFAVLVTGLVILLVTYIVVLLCKSI